MRILALWLLATWCAECVWGGFTVADYPAVALILGPLYGSVAVLIREVARRCGGGWPAMVLLATAFGLVQAGIVDQTLFDHGSLAGTEFADANRAAAATMVPVLDFSAGQLFDFVGNHVWLSICAPIALVEAFTDRSPWLRRRTIVLLVVLYVASSLLIWSDTSHVLSPAQILFVTLTAAVLVVAALLCSRLPRSSHRPASRRVPPLALGALVLTAHVAGWFYGSQWPGFVLRVVTLVLVAALVVRWAASQRHVVAAWGAGLLAAAGAAFLNPPYQAAAPWLMLLSDVVGAVFVVTLLIAAYRRVSADPRHERTGVVPV